MEIVNFRMLSECKLRTLGALRLYVYILYGAYNFAVVLTEQACNHQWRSLKSLDLRAEESRIMRHVKPYR